MLHGHLDHGQGDVTFALYATTTTGSELREVSAMCTQDKLIQQSMDGKNGLAVLEVSARHWHRDRTL